jgi:hypothetical protein
MTIHPTSSEVLLDDLECCCVACNRDVFIPNEHEIDEMQNAADVRMLFCKRHYGRELKRVDDLDTCWQRRSRVTETLDEVCEVLGQHMVVCDPEEAVLRRMTG